MKVAVVEDCAPTAESLCIVLELNGHETRSASDGPAGVELAASDWRPDVALRDIWLPLLDGYGVARQIRRRPGLERLPLIAVTAYGTAADRRRGMEAGFTHYLEKPFEPTAILELLAGWKG
jgi:CheY-like chemotaxis protein